jgi:hypothetical protein
MCIAILFISFAFRSPIVPKLGTPKHATLRQGGTPGVTSRQNSIHEHFLLDRSHVTKFPTHRFVEIAKVVG